MTEGKPTEWVEIFQLTDSTSVTALILAAAIGAAIVAAIMVYRSREAQP